MNHRIYRFIRNLLSFAVIIILLVAFTGPQSVKAQEIKWEKVYGGYLYEEPVEILQTNGGSYVAASIIKSNDGDTSYDYGGSDHWIVKFSKDNATFPVENLEDPPDVEWYGHYGGSEDERANAVLQMDDGGFLVAGYTTSEDQDVSFNHGKEDFWIFRVDSTGSMIYEETYGGEEWDFGHSVKPVDDGSFLLVGSHEIEYDEFHETGCLIVRLDANGVFDMWSEDYGLESSNEDCYDIQPAPDGGYVVVGRTTQTGGDFWIFKINEYGELVWEHKLYGGRGYESAFSIDETLDGGYIVAGSSTVNGAEDYWVLKLDDTGEIEWDQTYGGSETDVPYSIQATTDGGYIVAGLSKSSDGDISENSGRADFWILKLNEFGNIEWERSFGSDQDDVAQSVQQTNEGGYIVTGNSGFSQFWILKLNGSGNLEWEKKYEEGGSGHAYSVRQTQDGGYVLAGGTNSGVNGGKDVKIIKLGPEKDSGGDGETGGEAILTEDFEGTSFPPSGWLMQTTLADDLWHQYDHNSSGAGPANEQSRYTAMADWVPEDHDEWLLAPEFSLADANAATLSFHVFYDVYWIANATLKLNIRTGQTDPDWVTLWEAEDDGATNLQWRTIEVDLSDYAGADQVQLAWQYVGADGYIIGIDNIEVSATGSGNGGGDNYPVEVTASANVIFGDASSSQDFRLVALPGAVSEPLGNVLPGSHEVGWQAFWDDGTATDYLIRYDGSSTFTLEPGNGFWATATNNFAYSETVPTVSLDADGRVAIPLHDGWNIISNPLDIDVDWSDIESANGTTLQPIWGFEGSFSDTTRFPSAVAGQAFYFLNDQGLDFLRIPYIEASGTSTLAEKANSDRPKFLQLFTRVEGTRTSVSELVFGRESRSDVIAPSSVFEGASLRFVAGDGQEKTGRTNRLARIYRPLDPEGQRFDLQLSAEPDRPVVVSVSGWSRHISSNLVLLDKETGRQYDLTSGAEATIVPEQETTELLLVAGSPDFVQQQKQEFLPQKVEVRSNYPNPFNPATTIKFALPEQARVSVQIYDILGRRVGTLIDNEMRPAGVHTVTFDASRQASGVYFTIFEIGKQRFVQKMTLIK